MYSSYLKNPLIGVPILNLTIALLIMVLILGQKSHDCFVCLGKDPDRICYSIFQISTMKERRQILEKSQNQI